MIKRIALRNGLNSGELQRWPGAFSPLAAKLIADIGFDGVYVSGAVLAADLGLRRHRADHAQPRSPPAPDPSPAQPICRRSSTPTPDSGADGAARTVAALEDAGLAGLHLEDQVNPKRCGHLDGKDVVPVDVMLKRLRAAVAAKRDPNFVICARTDARGIEGFDAAVERAKSLRRRRSGPDLHRGADRPEVNSRNSARPWIRRCWRI